MSTGGNRTRWRRACIGLAVAMALLAGCEDSHLLTGAFRSTELVVLEDVPGLADGAYIELVLGQYGPDVAGIIRFFADPDFILPLEGVCHCRFLLDGRYGGGKLVFRFLAPYPCGAEGAEELAAWLTSSNQGQTLEGAIGRSYEGRAWTFQRTLKAQDLGTQDKTCDEAATGEPRDDGPGDGGVDPDGGAG